MLTSVFRIGRNSGLKTRSYQWFIMPTQEWELQATDIIKQGNTIVSQRLLLGYRPCTTFHWVNVAASIQTYAIYPWVLTRVIYLQSTLEQFIFRATWDTTWCVVKIFPSVTYTCTHCCNTNNKLWTGQYVTVPCAQYKQVLRRYREKCSHII